MSETVLTEFMMPFIAQDGCVEVANGIIVSPEILRTALVERYGEDSCSEIREGSFFFRARLSSNYLNYHLIGSIQGEEGRLSAEGEGRIMANSIQIRDLVFAFRVISG